MQDTWAAFAAFAFVTAVTPGPNNILLLSSGLALGFRRSLPVLAGIGLGFASMLLLVGAGIGQAFLASPGIALAVKIAGTAYFTLLAISLFGASLKLDRNDAPIRQGLWGGILLQFVNPKAWMMCVTAAGLYLPIGSGLAGLFQMVALYILIGTPCNALWLLAGDRIRRLARSAVIIRILNGTMAAFLILSLVWVWLG